MGRKTGAAALFLLPLLALGLLYTQSTRAGHSTGEPQTAYKARVFQPGDRRERSMANTKTPVGVQTTVQATGTDAPTSLNYPAYIGSHSGWEIANPSGTVIAWAGGYQESDNAQGWTSQGSFTNAPDGPSTSAITAFPLTPPSGTPAGTGYEIRAANPNGPNASAFFDVPASSRGGAFSETALQDGGVAGGTVSRMRVMLDDAVLVDGGLSGGSMQAASSRGGSFAERFLQDLLAGGLVNRPVVLLSDVLLTDSLSPSPKTYPPLALGDALLQDGLQMSPRTRAAAMLKDVLLTDGLARIGVSGSGGKGATVLLSDTLLTGGTAAGGPVSRLPLSFSDTVLTSTLSRTALSRTSVAFSGVLLTDRLISFPVQPAPLPEQPDERDPFFVLAQELRLLLSLKGSSMTLVSTLLAVTDKIAAAYRVSEISQAANTLATLPALIRGGDGVADKTYGFGQDAPILALLPAAESLLAGSAPNIILAAQYRGFMSALAGYASDLGFPSFDAYLSSLNTPAPYSALVHPNFALLNWLYNAQRGTLLMSPGNVFAPQTVFGTASVVSGSLAFTHLSDIPSANALSQTPGQSTQGYSAAPGVSALITAAMNGTMTATLTAFGQNAAGQAVTGRLWTAVLNSAATGSTIAFVPQVAGDRLYGITSLAGSGAATAGAILLNSVIERVVS